MKIRGSSDGLIMKLRGEKVFAAFHPIFPQRQARAKELFCSELFWASIVGGDEYWRNENKNERDEEFVVCLWTVVRCQWIKRKMRKNREGEKFAKLF